MQSLSKSAAINPPMDLQHFDIAHYAGHKAVTELAMAYHLYVVPFAEALHTEGIQVTTCDFKDTHDIHDLAKLGTIQNLDPLSIDPINAFHLSNYMSALQKREAEHCINAAIFFQVMMEASINEALGTTATGSFKARWDGFLKANNATSHEQGQLDTYFANIYKELRNKVVHPPGRTGVLDATRFRFPYAHENLKCGWYSFVFLLNKSKGFSLDYAANWQEMVQTNHRVPPTIVPADFRHMGDLASQLMTIHTDYLNTLAT